MSGETAFCCCGHMSMTSDVWSWFCRHVSVCADHDKSQNRIHQPIRDVQNNRTEPFVNSIQAFVQFVVCTPENAEQPGQFFLAQAESSYSDYQGKRNREFQPDEHRARCCIRRNRTSIYQDGNAPHKKRQKTEQRTEYQA